MKLKDSRKSINFLTIKSVLLASLPCWLPVQWSWNSMHAACFEWVSERGSEWVRGRVLISLKTTVYRIKSFSNIKQIFYAVRSIQGGMLNHNLMIIGQKFLTAFLNGRKLAQVWQRFATLDQSLIELHSVFLYFLKLRHLLFCSSRFVDWRN